MKQFSASWDEDEEVYFKTFWCSFCRRMRLRWTRFKLRFAFGRKQQIARRVRWRAWLDRKLGRKPVRAYTMEQARKLGLLNNVPYPQECIMEPPEYVVGAGPEIIEEVLRRGASLTPADSARTGVVGGSMPPPPTESPFNCFSLPWHPSTDDSLAGRNQEPLVSAPASKADATAAPNCTGSQPSAASAAVPPKIESA